MKAKLAGKRFPRLLTLEAAALSMMQMGVKYYCALVLILMLLMGLASRQDTIDVRRSLPCPVLP